MMGSTSNALDKGGNNYKQLYNSSDVTKRKHKLKIGRIDDLIAYRLKREKLPRDNSQYQPME